MNCLGHNPYIWLKYCFSLWMEMWNLNTHVIHPYHFLIYDGGKAYTDIQTAQRICVCLWQLETGATGLLQVKSSWANEVPWIDSKTEDDFSYSSAFWALAVTCAFSWEVAHACNWVFFPTVYCQNFGGPVTSGSACVIIYHQGKGLRLLFGMLSIQQ